MNLPNILTDHFKGLSLGPPLFYSWPDGLRAEIAFPSLSMMNATASV